MDVKTSYDLISSEFNHTRKFTWSWVDNYIIDISNKNKHLNILDIGCGNGRLLNYNKTLGINYNFFHNFIGLDISFFQLKNNTSKNELLQSNMIKIPIKDNCIDHILFIASFHHLKTIKERIECLYELKRILTINRNSSILLSVWSFNQPSKTKRKFNKYGDIIVNWKMKTNQIIPRYYYIFEINEIKILLDSVFNIIEHFWDCGNEIFILKLK